jgi:hypothetical protein
MYNKEENSNSKRKRKKDIFPAIRMFGIRLRCSRYVIIFLLVLIAFIFVKKMDASRSDRKTLFLDNERHLFIRLFKQNDPSRRILRPFRILSGSLHYFRVLPQSWPERIQQMKAAGLNTIETYIPWNIHEQEIGIYKFDDLIQFLKLVHQHEMFTIIRPSGKRQYIVVLFVIKKVFYSRLYLC